MLKKFAFQDDGSLQVIPHPTPLGDADDAGRQLNTDVLMTFDACGLKRLRENIDALLTKEAVEEALTVMEGMPVFKAMWWFVENVPVESPARTECFFALRSRLANEAG